MPTKTSNGAGGGLWSAGTTWVGGVAPVDNDTVVIQNGDTVIFDVDMSGWANGIAGMTIVGDNANPGMLVFKWSADGTYHLRIKTGTTVVGLPGFTYGGRILANSDGVWGNTGALPFGRKAIIDLRGTAKIVATELDIALYCTQPSVPFARVYGALFPVQSVDPVTNVITCAAPHGLIDDTPVMIRSSATLPGGLEADFLYYARDTDGADLQLAETLGGEAVDITSAGSGVIQLYNGQPSGVLTVNTLEDCSADPCWTSLDGHDAVVLANVRPNDYDQQRLTLTAVGAGTLGLSAVVDSGQYPGAIVVLISRNVSIRSNTTTAATVLVDYTAGSLRSGVFQCEIRSTSGTGTTFYGVGVSNGKSHVLSGSFSGLSAAVRYVEGSIMSSSAAGCQQGAQYPYGLTMTGLVAGCLYASLGAYGSKYSGTVCGCTYGPQNGGNLEVSRGGKIVGCNSVFGLIAGIEVYGRVQSCLSGGVNLGLVSRGGQYRGNTTDIDSTAGGTYVGYNAVLGGATKVLNYLAVNANNRADIRGGVMMYDYQQVAGAIGAWTRGGVCLSAAYNAGTHLVPPITPPTLIHEMTFQENDCWTWVEFPVLLLPGIATTIWFYGRLTAFGAFVTRPTIGIYDNRKGWQEVDEALAVSAQMAANTDWQSIKVSYMATVALQATIRVQGKGGDAGGTGTDQLYWFYSLSQAGVARIAGGCTCGMVTR